MSRKSGELTKIEPKPDLDGLALLTAGVIVAAVIIIALILHPDLNPKPMAPELVPALNCSGGDVLTMNIETGDLTCEPHLEPPWLDESVDCSTTGNVFLCQSSMSITELQTVE